MTHSLKVMLGESAQPADAAFYNLLATLEVEENADLPGAIELTLPIATHRANGADDLTIVGDDRFKPFARVAVVIGVTGSADACIFDGCVLSHRVHLDRGTTASTVKVWGQDLSCLMNLVETAHEWTDSDATIAQTIFTGSPYNFRASVTDDTGQHPDSGHTVMQRGTDAQFLRERARRAGKLFRVSAIDRPGKTNNTGYFIKPDLSASAATTLILNPVANANVDSLDLEWDVARPSEVLAKALLRAKDPVDGGTTDSGLTKLEQRSLGDLVGTNVTKMMLATSVDSAGELTDRARAVLRDAGWFVRCEGEADLARLGVVLRVGSVVQLDGAGKVHSGKYFVWSVRHTITTTSHRMKFVLMRNALGAP